MAAATNEKESLPDEEVMGQMNTFIAAGHDTMSSSLARLLHSLACDLPRQRRLREELTQARTEMFGELDFQTVTALRTSPRYHSISAITIDTYVAMQPSSMQSIARPSASTRLCPSRTAREPLPPPPWSVRRPRLRHCPDKYSATEAISIPLSAPIELSNGELVSEVPIAKGQTVLVSIEAVNHDPAIWGPDADKWVPERWLEGLPPSVQAAGVPGAFSHTYVPPPVRVQLKWSGADGPRI
jgi:cytochrome P450